MKDYEKKIKFFFRKEISSKSIPPFKMPQKRNRSLFRSDNFFLAACVLGSLILIAEPSLYENRVRQFHIPISKVKAFKENVSRVIFEASLILKEKQGVE